LAEEPSASVTCSIAFTAVVAASLAATSGVDALLIVVDVRLGDAS
jgi:hypothetical protein